MNPEKVAKKLPLYQFQIFIYKHKRAMVQGEKAATVEEAKSGKFSPYFVKSYDHYEQAFIDLMNIMTNPEVRLAQRGLTVIDPAEDEKLTDTLTFTEYVRGHDSGAEYSDPYNDIRKHGTISMTIWYKDDREQIIEGLHFLPSSPMYGICNAYTKMIRLYEAHLPTKSEIEEIVGFELDRRVYNNAYVMRDQMAVAGDCIEDGSHIKVEYFDSGKYVFWHKRDNIYVVGKNFYLNGQKIFDVKFLLDGFPDVEEYNILENCFYKCKDVENCIRTMYPNVRMIDGNMWSITLNTTDEIKAWKEANQSTI